MSIQVGKKMRVILVAIAMVLCLLLALCLYGRSSTPGPHGEMPSTIGDVFTVDGSTISVEVYAPYQTYANRLFAGDSTGVKHLIVSSDLATIFTGVVLIRKGDDEYDEWRSMIRRMSEQELKDKSVIAAIVRSGRNTMYYFNQSVAIRDSKGVLEMYKVQLPR
jgi:hypothetical protein